MRILYHIAFIAFSLTVNAREIVWDLSPSDDGSTNLEYRVYRSVSSGDWNLIATTRTNILSVDIVPGRNDFKVTLAMVDNSDESPPSNVLVLSNPHVKAGTFRIGK